MHIRPLRDADIAQVAALLEALAREHVVQEFSAEARTLFLGRNDAGALRQNLAKGFRYHVAESGGRIAGFVGTRDNRHLYHLFVAGDQQRRGLGRRLWETARAACVAAGNPGHFTVNSSPHAIAVYEKLGFHRAGKPRDHGGVIYNPMATHVLGSVARLWRYPVKSMLGEPCERLALGPAGAAGDRAFAVRDRDGKLGSGKNTRRFRSVDGLFGFSASGETPEIAFPDGRRIRVGDPGLDRALTDTLGIEVGLARESDVPHKDAAPIHLVTSAALAWLRDALPGSAIDERRFRPNLVIDAPGRSQVELGWTGRVLRVGESVQLRVIEPTERCRMTTLAQRELPGDPAVLRCIAQEAAAQFGVYAEVVAAGTIARDDPVVL